MVGSFGFLYASKPRIGEYAWQASYGTPWRWAWKPNCPDGSTANAAAGSPAGPYQAFSAAAPCVCHAPQPLSGCYPYGIGLQASLGILAATNFLGMLFTFLLPETNGKTLEELSGETEGEQA